MDPLNEELLIRGLTALEPVRSDLVLVGGTAHRLFRLHDLAEAPNSEPLTTEDVDFAAPSGLQQKGDTPLLDLLREASFEEELRGSEECPSCVYILQGNPRAYLQFIAHRSGDGTRQAAGRDRNLTISGICAEKLPHENILLHAPWQAELAVGENRLRFQVVNPSAYVAQKLATMHSRTPDKQAKDLLYIYDTLAVFNPNLEELGRRESEWIPSLGKGARKEIRRAAHEKCFAAGTTAGKAAYIAGEQRAAAPTPGMIVAACELGLPRMLPGLLGKGG
jgi:hypothetical protein